MNVVVTLGIVTLCPDAEGDLLGGELVKVEDTSIVREVLRYIKGSLTVDRCTAVRLPDRGGAAVLIGNADSLCNIRLGAGLGGSTSGGSVLSLYLSCLTGEVNPHIGSRDKPYLEFDKSSSVRVARVAGLAGKGDTVGSGDGIHQLLVEGRRVLRSERSVDHIISQRLFPQADVGAAVLNIKIQLRSSANLEIDLVDGSKIGQRKPCQRRCDQNKHSNNAQEEGEFPLNSRLCFLQFFELLPQL